MLSKENLELKRDIKSLEMEMSNRIHKDKAEQLVQRHEALQTELTETRAAMISYKNMTLVIADQAKNLKLLHERKKDENDNLIQALREVQSESVT